MGTIREFTDSIIVTIKESIKFAILTIFLFFLIGLPLAYICWKLNVDVEVAGVAIGIIVAAVVLYVDYKKFHCMIKIDESRYKFAKKLLKK